jgi:hypothetical protein
VVLPLQPQELIATDTRHWPCLLRPRLSLESVVSGSIASHRWSGDVGKLI